MSPAEWDEAAWEQRAELPTRHDFSVCGEPARLVGAGYGAHADAYLGLRDLLERYVIRF